MFITLMLFAWIRLEILLQRKNPSIMEATTLGYYDESEVITPDEIGFKIAFAVEGYTDRVGKDDPEYVEWVVQMTQNVGGVQEIFPLATHKCTSADYDSFFEPAKAYKKQIEASRTRGNMICIDEGQDLSIFGEGDTTDHRRLDFMLIPCQASATKNCPHNRQETIDYLGAVDLVMMYNQERFDQRYYEDNPIFKEAVFKNVQFDHKNPNFIHSEISLTEVQDEISYLQIGQFDEVEFFKLDIGNIEPSSWIQWPTRYKFTGVEVLLDFDKREVNRNTYDTLAMLGDVGGLQQGLDWIGILLVSWYSSRNGRSFWVATLFRQSKDNQRRHRVRPN